MVDIVSKDEHIETEKKRKIATMGTEGVSGKGDIPRPSNRKKWEQGYDRIFGKQGAK